MAVLVKTCTEIHPVSRYTVAIHTLNVTYEQENNEDKFCGNTLRTPFPSFGI